MIVNHLQTMHYKLGLVCEKCFCCPSVTSEAIWCHGWKSCQPSAEEALMSHLLLPNHKPEAQWINIPKMRLRLKIRRRIQCLLDCHIGNAPVHSMWNLRGDPAEGLPATKQMQAYCSNLPASCPDSSNMGQSPL